jgi:heme-degrading monooxygenase HmoA
MDSVVLINAFEMPEDRDEEFRAGWRAAADHLRQQPGFISTRLHSSLDPRAEFRYVNVAVWESPQHFQRAVGSDEFQRLGRQIRFCSHPALYRLVDE